MKYIAFLIILLSALLLPTFVQSKQIEIIEVNGSRRTIQDLMSDNHFTINEIDTTVLAIESGPFDDMFSEYIRQQRLFVACTKANGKKPNGCSKSTQPTSTPPNGCSAAPDGYKNASFTDACNIHDKCYDSYNAVKFNCDKALVDAVGEECSSHGYSKVVCGGIMAGFTTGLAHSISFGLFATAQATTKCIAWHKMRNAICNNVTANL